MAILRFWDDERGFTEWRDANPDGFVANSMKGETPFRLHVASCNRLHAFDHYTDEMSYKLCSLTRKALERRAPDLTECGHCVGKS